MIRIYTQFGVSLVFNEQLTDFEKAIYEYPYTADLCLAARQVNEGVTKVLQHRGITDPVEIIKIEQLVAHFSKDENAVPSAAKEMADAFHILHDSFPSEKLYLHNIHRDDMMSYFFFAPVKAGEALDIPVLCPAWLKGDFKALWEMTNFRRVGVGLNREEHSAAIAMEGFSFSIREYFAPELSMRKSESCMKYSRLNFNIKFDLEYNENILLMEVHQTCAVFEGKNSAFAMCFD